MVRITTLLGAAAGFAVSLAANNGNNNNNNNDDNAQASSTGQQGAEGTALSANAIQTGSFFTGQEALDSDAGQAASATDQANFINFCSGKTLTNGLQITTGSCNGIVMGDIPAKTQMISTVILNPQDGSSIEAGQTFNISLQVSNLAAGSFTNAVATYYSAPQSLSQEGIVVGHTHVTVQDTGDSLNPTTPLDPTQFAFFKGINDAGNGQGLLQAEVTGGLPAGNYRLCTLTSASNHQPVIMPVAQRGSQDDCTRFTVKGSGGSTNAAASNGATGQTAAEDAQDAVNAGPGALTSTVDAAGASNTAAAAAKGGNNNKNSGASSGSSSAASSSSSSAASSGSKNAGNSGSKNGQQKGGHRLARLRRRQFVA